MTKTINEITKTVASHDQVQIAQNKFLKDISKKGGVQTQSQNFDLENITLKEMDFTQTEELKDLGVIRHLEIPTHDGSVIYSFNNTDYSIQFYRSVESKKESLFAQLKNNNEYETIKSYIEDNEGVLDFKSLEAINYTRHLSDSDDVVEFNTLSVIVRDVNSQEAIGQIQYNDLEDQFSLYLGEEKVAVSAAGLEVTPAASCLVSWMDCMLKCLCGATSGSCAIAISGCIGACCGCTGWVSCIPCAGCITGVALCGNQCSSSK